MLKEEIGEFAQLSILMVAHKLTQRRFYSKFNNFTNDMIRPIYRRCYSNIRLIMSRSRLNPPRLTTQPFERLTTHTSSRLKPLERLTTQVQTTQELQQRRVHPLTTQTTQQETTQESTTQGNTATQIQTNDSRLIRLKSSSSSKRLIDPESGTT